jgi:hypothetical protein
MKNFPETIQPHEPTMKQLWLACFTSLLARLTPEEAVAAADRSLVLCNEHWKNPGWVHSWQYKHNFPVGTEFKDSRASESNLP